MPASLLKTMAGIDLVHVPYRNSGDARSGVIGGQVQMMIDAVPTMAPNIIAGRCGRSPPTTGKTRSSVAAGCCRVAEAGVPGYEGHHLARTDAHAVGTPKPIIDRLNAR